MSRVLSLALLNLHPRSFDFWSGIYGEIVLVFSSVVEMEETYRLNKMLINIQSTELVDGECLIEVTYETTK